MSNPPETVLCPSAPAQPGALVLGRFDADGKLGFLRQRLEVDSAFLDGSRQAGVIPEEHFRFSSPCLKKGCAQWSDGRCGIADSLVKHRIKSSIKLELRACAIRATCRWFNQEGAAICAICPEIATSQPTLETASQAI